MKTKRPVSRKKRSKNLRSKRGAPPQGPPAAWIIKIALGAGGLAIIAAAVWLLLSRVPEFDGGRAYQQLIRQCEFGPRVPGSSAHRECGDYLVSELQKYADRVQEQHFEYTDRHDSRKVYPGRNILASFNLAPEKGYRILLCAHWDSRPFADRDPNPVPGANDGASGVAVLLEMARILHAHPLSFGVDIALFDLEDLGDHGAALESDTLNPFCLGSQYFVEHLGDYRPAWGVLLDMVGDRDLTIKKEGYSQSRAAFLVGRIWRAARRVKARAFVNETGDTIIDDHVPFLQKGIQVVNLIDFDYPYWHTVEDTPDKCSAESLQQIGDVLVRLLYED